MTENTLYGAQCCLFTQKKKFIKFIKFYFSLKKKKNFFYITLFCVLLGKVRFFFLLISTMDPSLQQIIDEAVKSIIDEKVEQVTADLEDQIRILTLKLIPPKPEELKAVEINHLLVTQEKGLELVKSLPEFKGEISDYPGWRDKAKFAMKFYDEGSQSFYVATGILRNKITGSANAILASYNTALNYKAIFQRLDRNYADSRPLHMLKNELIVLRQGRLSLTEFHDRVDKQLTLIVNKIIMSHSGEDKLIEHLTNDARADALRVFVSGLNKPLCDTLYSARPKDLTSALNDAKDILNNQARNRFAEIYATGNAARNQQGSVKYYREKINTNFNKPEPMEGDPSTAKNISTKFPGNDFRRLGAIPKRTRAVVQESFSSNRSPIKKNQRLFHVAQSDKADESENELAPSDNDNHENVSDFYDNSNDELNFLA